MPAPLSNQDMKDFIHQHYKSALGGDEAALDSQFAPDFFDHDLPPDNVNGPEGAKQFLRALRTAIPDLQIDILDTVAENDRVAVRARWHGTHKGPFLGIPATGRPLDFTGMVFWRIDSNGRIAERWANLDRLLLMRQLGIVPTPPPRNP